MNKRLTITLAVLALVSQALTARATNLWQQPDQPVRTGLALEVTYYRDLAPAYAPVPGPDAKPGWVWYARFRRVPSWQPPAGSLPVKAVYVSSRLEGKAVRIDVSVYLGIKHFEKEQAVATYRVVENGRISVDGLKEFGVEPFEIKVVKVKPQQLNAPSVVNKTDSIEVLDVKANNSTLPSYTMTLRNLSYKNVSALGINVFAEGRQTGGSMPFDKQGRHLLEPGEMKEITVLGAKTARPTPEGYSPDAPPDQEIVIATAVFNDGSYEGDVEPASTFRGFRTGDRIQIPRLLELLKAALNSIDSNAPTSLEKLKTQAAALSTEIDPAALDELLREFPSFNEEEKATLKQAVEISLSGNKFEFIKSISEFEKANAQANTPAALGAWLSETHKRFETLLSRRLSER